MIVPAHINFFDINECGLYRQGQDRTFGLEAPETFDLIYRWVQGKPMEDTIPWDPRAGRSGTPLCYCHDYYRNEESNEYLFVLWKSHTGDSGGLLGAVANAPTGHSTVYEQNSKIRGSKVIWGHPCYYWVIPALNTVASIKLDHSLCDSTMFQDWTEKCITNRVSHGSKVKSETEGGQIRFEYINALEPQRYSYRFRMLLKMINTGSTELRDLASRVTHIIRRDTIKLDVGNDERDIWVKLFDKIPRLPARPKAKFRQIEVRGEAKPSIADIKHIIENFSIENRKRSDWNNVGFETDTGTVWVDKYRLHETIHVNKPPHATFAASALYVQLSRHRERFLSEIGKHMLKPSRKRSATSAP